MSQQATIIKNWFPLTNLKGKEEVRVNVAKINEVAVADGNGKESLVNYYFGKELHDLTDQQASFLLTEVFRDLLDNDMFMFHPDAYDDFNDYEVGKLPQSNKYQITVQSKTKTKVRRYSGGKAASRVACVYKVIDPSGKVIHEAARLKPNRPVIKYRPLMNYNPSTPNVEGHPYYIIDELLRSSKKLWYCPFYEVVN